MTKYAYLEQKHLLNSAFLEKNFALLQALKQKRPADEIQVLHSGVQEVYNQIEALKRIPANGSDC